MLLRLLRLIISLVLTVSGLAARAQAPTWQSALVLGDDASIVYATITQADANGNVYIAGSFKGSLLLGNSVLTSLSNSFDVFIAKCDASTNSFIWARQAGGTGDDVPTAMAVNSAGIYLTGTFSNASATFGSFTLPNAGSADVFITKLTDTGNSAQFTWAKSGGGAIYDTSSTIAASAGVVYVGIGFSGEITGGTTQFGGITFVSGSNNYGTDALLCRLTESGNDASFTWVSSLPYNSTNSDAITGLTISGTDVYIGGYYNSRHTTGVGQITQNNFLTKVLDSGTSASYVWKQEGNWEITALASNGSTVYLVGGYYDEATFGNTTLTAYRSGPPARSNNELFVAKLLDVGSAGNFVWAVRSMSGSGGASFPRALLVDGLDLYLTGEFAPAEFTLGTILLKNDSPARPSYSVFVAKLRDNDNQGAFVWAQQATGVSRPTGLALTKGIFYVTGYQDHATFGSFPLNSTHVFFSRLSYQPLPTRSPALQAALGLYPNPAHGTATVRVPAGTGPATLTLLDALGRVVRTQRAPAGADYPFGLAGIVPGIYTLRVQVGEALATQKLAVE